MGVQINGDTGNISATKADYSGNVTIGGTLTYEDVTNIDSVGLVTARTGIEIGARPGVAASISVDGNMIVSGISTFGGALSGTTGTFSGDVSIADKIVHTGDTDTAIRFSGADTITAETGGSERVRITSGGQIFMSGNTGYNESASLISLATEDSAAANMLSDSSAIYNHTNPAFIHVQNRYNTGDGQEAGIILHSKSSFGGAWAIYGKRTSSGFLSDLIFRNRTASSTSAERLKIASGGDVTVTSGNLVIGTAGKGIDFSAQTATSASGASATSELLDHYEEGTWTPAITGSSSTPNYSTSSAQGRYVRIGSNVTLYMLMIVSAVASQGSGNYGITGLPFSVTSDISSYSMVGVVGYNDVFNSTVNKCYANSNNSITFIPDGVTQGNVTISGNSFSTGYLGLTLSYHTS